MSAVVRVDFWLLIGYWTVLLLRVIHGQCSDLHRESCTRPVVQLNNLSSQITPSIRHIPDYNQTTLVHVCSLYIEYKNCSKPFIPSCANSSLLEMKILDSVLGLLCADLIEAYLEHLTCYQRRQQSYANCQQKVEQKFKAGKNRQLDNSDLVCSITKDYVLCVYTSTALACSIPAADTYFKLLNYSLTTVLDMSHFNCILLHPMDVVPLYTTTSSTTSTSITSETSRDLTTFGTRHSQIVLSRACLIEVNEFIVMCSTSFVFILMNTL
ncbi:hypothetical protein CHS0354_005144 [Potamilus streckersoni]|uniref:Uncharacterized protein n=1 Tax=Potamilus streckersoni TaxID=2493646 RepID=A0AAE0SHA5_9BIVA|nr:hypothetical protein CHS0354_005144 [Potamilus streckersoni]